MLTFFTPMGHPLSRDPEVSPAGYLSQFFDPNDPSPARMQIDRNYQHGGGWRPFGGFKYTRKALYYPGDRPMRLVAWAQLREETLRLYEGAWLAIEQKDGSVEIAHVD